MAYTVSFHNGRGRGGKAYDVKHNDRDFSSDYAQHIDFERAKRNVYWDCYQGLRNGDQSLQSEQEQSLSQSEYRFYCEHYGAHVAHQNERNEKSRHPERNRTIEDVLKDGKTCPEESIYQLGNIGGAVDPEVLVDVVQEFLEERDRKYGAHVHCLNWALHVDEATPHIHERHVFDCTDRYGDLFLKQEQALEALGFNLPNPSQKMGKFNNRKMVFDAEMRKRLMEIAADHGVAIVWENTTGGRGYLEKNDYIISQQKQRMTELDSQLQDIELKIEDAEKLIDEVSVAAYDKALEVMAGNVQEALVDAVSDELDSFKTRIEEGKTNIKPSQHSISIGVTDAIKRLIGKAAKEITSKILGKLKGSKTRAAGEQEIAVAAKKSLLESLAKRKEEIAKANPQRKKPERRKGIERQHI